MSADAPPVDVPMIPVDDLPDLPTCRVTTTVNPVGGIWFEITRGYARDLRDQLQATRPETDTNDLVPVVFPMDYAGYRSLTKGFAQLHRSDESALKQVRPQPTAGDLAIAVYCNDSQIESSMRKNYATLKAHGPGRPYGQKFTVSYNGSIMLEQQLEAALGGSEDPLEAIDMEDSRFVPGGDDQ